MSNEHINTPTKTMQPKVAEKSWKTFLVSDHPTDATSAIEVLEQINNIDDIITLQTGKALLTELKAHKFYDDTAKNNASGECLIILDTQMPEDNGISILQELKESPYTNEIPVLILAQKADTNFIETTYNMKAIGCLTKPLTRHHISIIQNIFSKHKS